MHIQVKVFPGSPKEVIVKEKKRLKVFLREDAKDNQANKSLRTIMAKHFNVATERVQIISGHKHQNKTLEIQD